MKFQERARPMRHTRLIGSLLVATVVSSILIARATTIAENASLRSASQTIDVFHDVCVSSLPDLSEGVRSAAQLGNWQVTQEPELSSGIPGVVSWAKQFVGTEVRLRYAESVDESGQAYAMCWVAGLMPTEGIANAIAARYPMLTVSDEANENGTAIVHYQGTISDTAVAIMLQAATGAESLGAAIMLAVRLP